MLVLVFFRCVQKLICCTPLGGVRCLHFYFEIGLRQFKVIMFDSGEVRGVRVGSGGER